MENSEIVIFKLKLKCRFSKTAVANEVNNRKMQTNPKKFKHVLQLTRFCDDKQ